jgi:hypothetical protein
MPETEGKGGAAMAVFRIEKTKDYTVMSNHHLRNRSLSLKAKGLLSQMLSLPEDWDYTLAGLSRINREGIDAIREAVRELEQAGYITRSRARDERGHLRGTEYVIHEMPPEGPGDDPGPGGGTEAVPCGQEPGTPTLGFPTLDNPTLGNPTLGNPTQLNIEVQSKEEQSKEGTKGLKGKESIHDKLVAHQSTIVSPIRGREPCRG